MATQKRASLDRLKQATDLHNQGHYDEAARRYLDVIRQDPRNWQPHYLLARLHMQKHEYALAHGRLEQTVQLNPQAEEAWLALGDVCSELNLADQAMGVFQRILARNPRHAMACFKVAYLHEAAGRNDEAAQFYQRAVEVKPAFPEAWNNLGNVRRVSGHPDAARAAYEKAVALRPNFAEACNNMAVLLLGLSPPDKQAAMDFLKKAVACREDYPEAHVNLGATLVDLGRLQEGIGHYEKALQLKPDYAYAWNNLGAIYYQSGMPDEASVCFSRSVEADPKLAEAHNNLGLIHNLRENRVEARECFETALRCRPDFPEAYNGLGLLYTEDGQFELAEKAFHQALGLRPQFADAAANLAKAYQTEGMLDPARLWFARSNEMSCNDSLRIKLATMVPAIMGSRAEVEQSRRLVEQRLAELKEQPLTIGEVDLLKFADTNFFLAFQGFNDRDIQATVAQLFLRACPSLGGVAPHVSTQHSPGARIKVGFVSRYFWKHSVGNYYAPMICILAQDPRFEVTLIHVGQKRDEVSAAMARSVHHEVTLGPISLATARERVALLELDVIVYTDIGMDPFTYFLSFARLARLQCVSGGHPVTTGVPNMDVYLSSRYLEGGNAQDHYTEHLLQMSHYNVTVPDLREPVITKTRAELGLPTSSTAYVCPTKLQKLHPDFDLLIRDLLARDRDGTVVLFEDDRHRSWHVQIMKRLRQLMGSDAERVLMLPFAGSDDFFQILALADVVLDPFHFGLGTTGFMAFAAAAPVVTHPSPYLRARVVHACYRQMDFLECVADTPADYLEIALRLAKDGAFRIHVVNEIRARRQVLFGDAGCAHEMADFFVSALG
jgi:predicted O-linked N-acetylglucosamine transferase (SPINDLY family)